MAMMLLLLLGLCCFQRQPQLTCPHYIVQAGFKHMTILLPQHPEFWDYRLKAPHLALLLLFLRPFIMLSCLGECTQAV